jgi:hypothetical protein
MGDKIVVNGMLWGKVEPLLPPIDYDEFANIMLDALGREKEHFRADTNYALSSLATRGAFEFRSPDLNDPLEVKWALLLPPRSPETEAIAAALEPLVKHRRGQVIFSPSSPTSTFPEEWILDHYSQIDDDERPYYMLLAGNLEAIPFRFQYLLDVQAAVGRLSFDQERFEDQLESYAAYAKKVVDFETRANASVAKRAVFFATEHAGDGATLLSRQYMADNLVKMVKEKGIPYSYVAGEEATLENLKAALTGDRGSPAPALVYTASHGLGVPGSYENEEVEKIRRQLQGAIVCQDYDGQSGVFSANKVPETSFLHGSIIFTFACYGAGTPKQSDFFHWVNNPRLLNCRPASDFIAALPKKLLAHPQGPLAFIGHLDPAWVYSFADPNRIADDKGWGSRMSQFRQAADHILQGATVGYAMKKFNDIYAGLSVKLVNTEDEFRHNPQVGQASPWTRRLVDTWMTRNDIQNFIVLGDPAAKAKML